MTPTTRTPPPVRATLADLIAFDGRGELVGGRIIELMGNGLRAHRFSQRIWLSLNAYAEAHGGEATGDGLIYSVPRLPSGRESFLPDAAYYNGPPLLNDLGVVRAAPAFAVEVRSQDDYGPAMDREYAAKRADYFAAGTLVVWDVDPVAGAVAKYTAADPLTAQVFAAGDVADAEPAVPGWRVAVDWLTRPGTNR